MRTIVLYEKFITSALHSYQTASVAATAAAAAKVAITLGVLAIACVSFSVSVLHKLCRTPGLFSLIWFGLFWLGLKCNTVTMCGY